MRLEPIRDPSAKAVAGRSGAYLMLHNTSEVVTPDPQGQRIVRYPKGAVVFQDGRVVEVGNGADLLRRYCDKCVTSKRRMSASAVSSTG